MRNTTLLILFFIISYPLFGQTYYVAVVHGNVYFNNKKIKKRDKIKMQGNLKFTSAKDYVKLSGKGGLYTIRPNSTPAGNEFLIAVKEELFPKTRNPETLAYSFTMNEYPGYFTLEGYSPTLFEKDMLAYTLPPLKKGMEYGYLLETDKGLIYHPAKVKNQRLAIREKDFRLKSTHGVAPKIKMAYIVKVLNKKKWKTLIHNKKSIAQIDTSVKYYYHAPIDSSLQTPIIAEMLDRLSPPNFVNKRQLKRDLRFHIKKTNAPDIKTFLYNYEFNDYINDTYGPLRGSRLEDLLRELGLKN